VCEDEERSHSHQQKDQNNHKEQRQYNFSRQASNSLDEYYKILGIPATATDDEVKKAWRKKAQEFHPDKVQGTGLSDAFVEYATEQIKKINEAYEKICAARKK
jgi:DnaJ like chaperone protein